jgi:XapX domain-containing protein
MKLSLVSLAVGLVVGALYGVLNVRSPSPPVVALVQAGSIFSPSGLCSATRSPISNEMRKAAIADFMPVA